MPRAIRRRRALLVLAAVLLVAGACDPLSYLPGTPRPSWCDPTDIDINDGHTAGFFASYSTPKGPLSQLDCQEVTANLKKARAFAAQFPTVADVRAAGWIQATVWTPGQGIHFVDPTRALGPFDPRRPNWLQYNSAALSGALVGMMFLEEGGSSPPEGFAGANDHWHNHDELCIDADAEPYVVAEHVSDSLCAAWGGVNMDVSNQWMVHAWLPTYGGWEPTDIFNNNHPSLP